MKTIRNKIRTTLTQNFGLSFGCALAVVALVILSGCTEKNAAPATGRDETYRLVSVNGNALPASLSHEGAALKVLSGSFAFEAGGTCRSTTVFAAPSGKETQREVSATYTENGANVTMRWKGAGRTTGSIAGNTLTMHNEGMIFVYEKGL